MGDIAAFSVVPNCYICGKKESRCVCERPRLKDTLEEAGYGQGMTRESRDDITASGYLPGDLTYGTIRNEV